MSGPIFDNMFGANDKSIIVNTGFRWAGEIVNKALWFVFVILLARKLGAAGFGYFNYAFSFAGLLVIFADLGTSILLVRKASRERERTGYYLSNILGIKCFVSLLVLVIAFLIPKEPAGVSLSVMLFSIALVASGFLDPFNAVYRVNMQMHKETAVMLAWRFLIVGLSCLALYILNAGLNGVGIAFVAATAAAMLVTFLTAKKSGILVSFREIDVRAWKSILRESVVVGSLFMIGGIYFKFNMVLLQYLGRAQAVGWYGAAFKLIEGCFFVSSFFIASLFPLMCGHNLNREISDHGMSLFRKALLFLAAAGTLIAILAALFAGPLIRILYGPEYLPAVDILRILAWSLVFIYINELFTFFFLSADRQKSMFKILLAGLIVYTLLCVILIPQYGYLGAAWVLLITEGFVTLLNMLLLKRAR